MKRDIRNCCRVKKLKDFREDREQGGLHGQTRVGEVGNGRGAREVGGPALSAKTRI